MYIFEISTKRRIFWCPIRPTQRKKFSSLRRDNELFWELKRVKNGRNRSKFRKTVFYKQILDFHCPSKILCNTSNVWNFDGNGTDLKKCLTSVKVNSIYIYMHIYRPEYSRNPAQCLPLWQAEEKGISSNHQFKFSFILRSYQHF